MEYEFLFVVEGVSVDDDETVGVIFDQFDGLLAVAAGQTLLSVSETGDAPVDASHRLVARLRSALPGMRLLRTDLELVGIADIAERTGRTRQNVAQWVRGERQADDETPFPPAEGTVGRSLAWRWAEVNGWLERIGAGDGVARPSRDEALIIDLMVRSWQDQLADGMPLLKVVAADDDRAEERQAVMAGVEGLARQPEIMRKLATLPRNEPHRLAIVCAVLLDRLEDVVKQLGPYDVSGVLAVMTGEGELHLTSIAAVPLPGAVPVARLGLSARATVGDLVLLQANGTVAPTTPLALT
ncbi:helix-turn-helix transcriptional regulator [Streptomyces sp. H27-D2]|uniref:helix-turn-helix transcriptional regulator n=1 Tax=Streptomyces sp. H27-D2 TaxID=3046304 RepID=UPI002DBF163C|nr:hypothetical protein [Streptomyces sp. H27-D2]MEC4014956.1 hypothetical protein [Streptomyces sp. H27-D2]